MSALAAGVAATLVAVTAAAAAGPELRTPRRPVATYSIVAFDPASGQLGVAVQSHWFSVGPVVPWVEAGVGAVATQSLVDVSYGPLGLEMMAAGKSAPDALAGLLASDSGREVRQVAVVDAAGRVAVHTGTRCIAQAGHVSGPTWSVQANLMARDTVWPAMAKAFEAAQGDLAERLMKALEAAESEGGDVRGRQSAALVVASGQPTGQAWRDRVFDLRVEDHPQPLSELRRLLEVARAYREMNDGDEHLAAGRLPQALEAYARAEGRQPDNAEIAFWVGVTLAESGRLEDALPRFRRAFERHPPWRDVVPRLVEAGLLADDPARIAAILAAGSAK